jgi:hypothetical protein
MPSRRLDAKVVARFEMSRVNRVRVGRIEREIIVGRVVEHGAMIARSRGVANVPVLFSLKYEELHLPVKCQSPN